MKTKILLIAFLSVLLWTTAKAETEPNDTKAQANNLALGGSQSGTAELTNEDWFKVTITSDGQLNLTLNATSGQWVRCYVYDKNGITQINYGETSSTTNVNTDGLAEGTYYVKLAAYYTNQSPTYTISSSLISATPGNDNEPNDTKAQALTLPLNGSKTGHVGYYYDLVRDTSDWYKVTLDADGLLRLSLTPHNGKYVWIYLYDKDGTTLLNSSYDNAAFSQSTDGLAAGTYYLRIKCYYTSDFAPYTLSDSLFTPSQYNDAEPNDSKSDAIKLPLNGTKKGHVGYYYNNHRDTSDWYKLTTDEDGLVRFTLTPANGKYVWVYLYDKDGTTLLTSSYSNATFTQSTDGLAKGTYYVRVKCYYTSEFAPYTLSDSLFTYNYEADKEPNRRPYQAKTLPANQNTEGHVGFLNDNTRDTVDWWKINYTGNGNLTINLNLESWKSTGVPAYTYIQVYSDTAASPIYSQYSNSGQAVVLNSLSQGYYYVKIYTYYNYHFQAYQIKPVFTQVNKAKIEFVSSDAGTTCNSGTLEYKCSRSKKPYTVQLYRYGVAYGDPMTVNNTGPFTFEDLPPGVYYATAYGDGATGNAYGTSEETELAPKPTGLSTMNIQDTKATLNWTGLACIDFYKINYREVGSGTWLVKNTTNNSGTYVLKNLDPNTSYEWKVASVDEEGAQKATSNFSAIYTFTTDASFAGISGADERNVKANNANSDALVYPNPASTQFTIQLNSAGVKGNEIVSVSLKDANGKIVWSASNVNSSALKNMPVNVSKMPPGIYYLQISGTGNNTITQKVVVSR